MMDAAEIARRLNADSIEVDMLPGDELNDGGYVRITARWGDKMHGVTMGIDPDRDFEDQCGQMVEMAISAVASRAAERGIGRLCLSLA